ncbi:hypothetical protein FRC06_002728 [Ceratobasidium sp. 370]|nr:hypothetical protein FRC06_002728 [Ceratobasidium sp. 370]
MCFSADAKVAPKSTSDAAVATELRIYAKGPGNKHSSLAAFKYFALGFVAALLIVNHNYLDHLVSALALTAQYTVLCIAQMIMRVNVWSLHTATWVITAILDCPPASYQDHV